VKHDRLAIDGQHNVDLDRRRTQSFGGRERRQGILRVAEAVAPVAAHMDAPGFARQKAERHGPAGSFFW
jgi:hypothetical protein